LGKSGLRRIAEINVARAHEAHAQLLRRPGLSAPFTAPFFNEFVLRSGKLTELYAKCAAEKIVPGIALERDYPELKNAFLICVTEMNEREEIDRLVRTSAG
jgi:glycine dehydrogenase subunit 1